MNALLSKIKSFSIYSMMALLLSATVLPTLPAQAARYYSNNYNPNNYYGGYAGYGNRPNTSSVGNFFYNHPYVQKAAVIGGAGAAVGALTAGDGYRMDGAVKGAAVGAGLGLGYEYLREKGIIHW